MKSSNLPSVADIDDDDTASVTTATLPPVRPQPRDVASIAKDVADQYRFECEEAETLLQQIIAEDRKATKAELVYFSQRLGWDTRQVNSQYRRVHNVVRFQAIAGSPEAREAAIVERDKSAEIAEKECPKLRAKIEALQKQIDALERDAKLSAKRVDEQTEAVKQLRDNMPRFIIDAHSAENSTISYGIGKQLSDAIIRRDCLKIVFDKSKHANEQEHLQAIRRVCFDAVIEIKSHTQYIAYGFSDAWPSIRAGFEQELAELEATIPVLQAEFDELQAINDQKLDYYTTPESEA